MKLGSVILAGLVTVLALAACNGEQAASSLAGSSESLPVESSSAITPSSSSTSDAESVAQSIAGSMAQASSNSDVPEEDGNPIKAAVQPLDYDEYFSQERLFDIDPEWRVPRAVREAKCPDGWVYYAGTEGGLYRKIPATGEIELVNSEKTPVDLMYTDGNILFYANANSGTVYRLHFLSGVIDTLATLGEDYDYLPYSNFMILWTERVPGFENFRGTTPTTLHAWDTRVGAEVEPPMGAFFPLYGTYNGPRTYNENGGYTEG